MKLRHAVVFASLLGAASSAHAFGIGLRAGTSGIGGDLGGEISSTLYWRVGASGLNYSTTFDDSDVTYDAKIKMANVNALLDWSPIGPFRLTGGVIFNDNKYNLTGKPNAGTYTNNVGGAGVNFYFDLGVMFQGSPKATLNATCGAGLSAAQCTQLQNDVAAEQARVQDKIKNWKYYPVLNFRVTIGF